MDDKIARLKGTGTVLGGWLDYVFDRVRVLTCTLTLMWGAVRRDRKRTAEVIDLQEEFRQRFTWYFRVRDWLREHRVRTHLVSGIEFQMAVFIVGPRADISARQRLGKEDQIDERTFSEAVWTSVKGARSQMPAPGTSCPSCRRRMATDGRPAECRP
ncbi:MAG: hypothetical protein JWR24_5331 [Actinoallomurus sp.]|nr:hypothetical protein [Actinoallomurus sp.]